MALLRFSYTAVPCAWDRSESALSFGNEVRLYGRPHCCCCCCVFSRPEVMVKTCVCVCLLTQQMVSLLHVLHAKKKFLWTCSKTEIFFNLLKSDWKASIEFGICNKNCIDACNKKKKKQACCVYYIWTDEKATAPGASALKAEPRTQPDGAEKQSSELQLEQNSQITCICFFVHSLVSTLPPPSPPPSPSPPSWTDRRRSVSQLVLLVKRVGLSLFC